MYNVGPIALPDVQQPLLQLDGKHAPIGAPAGGGLVPFKLLSGAVPRVPVPDSRVAPWRTVGLLNFYHRGILVTAGTGFMCAPDIMLTARHNLTGKTFDAAGVWMAYDKQKNPVGPIGIVGREVHPDLDLAVLVLAASQPSFISLASPSVPATAQVSIYGYGFPDLDNTPRLSMATGPVNGSDNASLAYLLNTQEGDSGAPIVARGGAGTVSAVAVHTTSKGTTANSNFGTLLTPEVISTIGQLVARARSAAGSIA